MIPPKTNGRKAPGPARIQPEQLFRAMAYDLDLVGDRWVEDCHALLCGKKYLSFINQLDAKTSQMYESTGELLARQHQLAALFSKFPFEDRSIDREAVALRKFEKAEHRCRRMNQKFRARRSRMEPPHMQFMRDYLLQVLGATPNYQSIYRQCDFGPGSSVGVHGEDVSCLQKLDALTVTPGAMPVALTALMKNYHYSAYLFAEDVYFPDYELMKQKSKCVVVQYNKIVCVPKNAKTDRTIAIEPSLNGFIQKGIDLVLRSKLLRVGVDLSKQTLNQALARLGSIGRGYATIDLSAASDSISIELARELLPPDWFSLLNSVRSASYKLPSGEIKRYHKFCSMGNGFCFPLETLLFLAASEYAMSITQIPACKTRSVYGDDIIVPQECALVLLETLKDMGFTHNEDKTFIVGSFRESCGADFFNGVNVRPVYIKKPLVLGPQCYPLLNELARRKLAKTWHTLYNAIPLHLRYTRPYPRDDDTAITVPMDMFMTSKGSKWDRSIQAWTWKGVVSTPLPGRKPSEWTEWFVGLLRGDVTSANKAFTARFSERTRIQRFC